jgi:hypothetical protein
MTWDEMDVGDIPFCQHDLCTVSNVIPGKRENQLEVLPNLVAE